jgi:phage protein D
MSDALIGPSTPRPSQVRRPRGIVRIGGTPVSFLSFSVTNKGHFTADTFRVELECWQQPQGFGLAYWAGAPMGTTLEVLIGELGPQDDVGAVPSNVTSLILGQIDDVEPELIGGKLTLTGRDLSALFIDTKTTNKWPTKTASEIVTLLAQAAGLTPNVTATTGSVGELINSQWASLTRDIPQWDLMVFLAQQEGFDLYVTGSTLYFGPAEDDPSPYPVTVGTDAFGRIWSNAKQIRPKRSLTLAKDISVTVMSHGVQSGRAIHAVATRAGTKGGGTSHAKSAGNVQNYVIRRPNLTMEQAQQLANQTLAELTKWEKTLEVSMEGDPTITVQRMLHLTGTGSVFDQDYYIDQITRSYAFNGSFDMTIHAKNSPVVSQPNV